MTPRLCVERELLARLLAETDHARLRRRLLGLHLAGISNATFSGGNGHLFRAIVSLAARGEFPYDASLQCETQGRVAADYVSWVRTAYATQGSLYSLALALLDANRRMRADSAARTLLAAIGDPAVDVDRAIAAAVGALRRVGRDAA